MKRTTTPIFMKESFSDDLKSCVDQVQAQGHDEQAAYAICRVSLGESGDKDKDIAEAGRALSKKNEADLDDALKKIQSVLSKVKEYDKDALDEIERKAKEEQQAQKKEKGEYEESNQLIETRIRSDNTVPILVISPGWGSSGYYAESVLRDGAPKYKAGTQMYWDHPEASENYERPERSLRDLAGVLQSDGYYSDSGPSGPGVYADAKVFDPFQDAVQEMGEFIGVSHRAKGTSAYGEAEGRKGTIIESIDDVISVDFVTLAGRGGEIVQLIESKRNKKGDEDMKWSDITLEGLKENRKDLFESAQKEFKESVKLEEKNTLIETLSSENKQLKEAKAQAQLKELVESVAKEASLPDPAVTRIVKEASVDLPLTDKLELDYEKVQESVKKAVKDEMAYIQQVSGGTGVKNFAESAQGAGFDAEQSEASLVEAFKGMGLDEEAAKVAAKGRK
ncbi:hypothetical protein [Alkalicoccus chagannorensis]|uniref:hypothetical protein n=1 Tax=Alkalicoccus chagannorensis TaxID=427072 RepID=UPI00047AF828|nr:hypothetical protein [Alkalicoccus chagannorensis]